MSAKKIFLLLFTSTLFFTASAQYYDSTHALQRVTATGNDVNNLRIRGGMWLPQDTFKLAVKDSGALAWKNGNVYKYSGYSWARVSGTGSTNLNIGSAYRLAVPGTNNIKTISAGTGIALDSSTTGQIGITNTGVVTASNGLTLASSNVKLGGRLTNSTTVSGTGAYDFNFDSLTVFRCWEYPTSTLTNLMAMQQSGASIFTTKGSFQYGAVFMQNNNFTIPNSFVGFGSVRQWSTGIGTILNTSKFQHVLIDSNYIHVKADTIGLQSSNIYAPSLPAGTGTDYLVTAGSSDGKLKIISAPQQYVTTSDFDKTSNTTLANVPGLSATVYAGQTFKFVAEIYSTSADITGGVKFAMGGTVVVSSIIYDGVTWQNGTISQVRATSLGDPVGNMTNATEAHTTITGTITVGTTGTLTVQFAQNVSDPGTSSVMTGSTFTVIQIL